MFLRVSSPACASVVEGNPYRCRPLPRASTRCGVVNPHVRITPAPAEPSGPPGATAYFGRAGRPRRLSRLNIDADFVVAVGCAGLGGHEQHPRAPGREPAGEELGGAAGADRLAEQRLEPAAGVGPPGGPAARHLNTPPGSRGGRPEG